MSEERMATTNKLFGGSMMSPIVDPYPVYKRLRDEQPALPVNTLMGVVYMITRYDDILTVLKDGKRFSSRANAQMDDVMGALGDEDIEIVDAATQVKIAPKRIVEEAVRAGALGFSTSRTPLHRAKDGRVVPGTTAGAAELTAIGEALAAAGGGVFHVAPDQVRLDEELGWPVGVDDWEDAVYDWQPEELNLKPEHQVAIKSIKQLKPLVSHQPYFFWDVLTTAYLGVPELFTTRDWETEILVDSPRQGRTALKPGGRKVTALHSVDVPKFYEHMLAQWRR